MIERNPHFCAVPRLSSTQRSTDGPIPNQHGSVPGIRCIVAKARDGHRQAPSLHVQNAKGIEFDYSCVHGVMAAAECGYETIMINCNPETVSTDFNMADKLYFEPVFWEHVREIIDLEKPEGVIVQLGGQTALKMAEKLHEHGIKIIGTSFNDMDIVLPSGRLLIIWVLNILTEGKGRGDG